MFAIFIIAHLFLSCQIPFGHTSDVNYDVNHLIRPTTGKPFGIVVFSSGWIGIIDPDTQTVSTPLLLGEFGDKSSTIMDVAITPGGNLALVSNFNEKKVFFIDCTDQE